MKIYNSLSREIETFEPLLMDQSESKKQVRVYTCGPTVYSYVSIGNWRTYVLGDLVVRALKYMGYEVTYVMNITDVGHLTGDNLGDADLGEDRLEKAARKEGKSAWVLAKFYTNDFLEGFEKLGLVKPNVFCKATDHIKEQIEAVKAIEKKGFVYWLDDGIYFDVGAWEAAGNKYGELSTLDSRKAGARVEVVKGKKDSRDFALWKFDRSKQDKQELKQESTGKHEFPTRQMNWWFEGEFEGEVVTKENWKVVVDSDREALVTLGFPGWHIECSAMSQKYLGDQFDLHLGGEDLRSTHHPNEIVQAEAVTGKKPFVKYWMHGAFLTVDGGRMGKSLGNAYTLHDIEVRGFSPSDLKYFYLTGHYRKQLNFTWKALEAAREANKKLRGLVSRWSLDGKKGRVLEGYLSKFSKALENDLNMPEALAVVWEMVKAKAEDQDKLATMLVFDRVLGLELEVLEEGMMKRVEYAELPDNIKKLVNEREKARNLNDFEKADELRNKLGELGYRIEDTKTEQILSRKV